MNLKSAQPFRPRSHDSRPETDFNHLPSELQDRVAQHCPDDVFSATKPEQVWSIARANASLCTVNKRFHESVQPFVHLNYWLALTTVERASLAQILGPKSQENLLRPPRQLLYQRLKRLPEHVESLPPMRRLAILVDARLRVITQEEFSQYLDLLIEFTEAASQESSTPVLYKAIPTLMAFALCRTLWSPTEDKAWHLLALQTLMDTLGTVDDHTLAVPALLQIAVTTIAHKLLGSALIRLRVGGSGRGSYAMLSTEMVSQTLRQRGGHFDDNLEQGCRAVAAILVSTPQAPVPHDTVDRALDFLETFEYPLIGVWNGALIKLQGLDLPEKTRERLERCVLADEQKGLSPNAPSIEHLLKRV